MNTEISLGDVLAFAYLIGVLIGMVIGFKMGRALKQ